MSFTSKAKGTNNNGTSGGSLLTQLQLTLDASVAVGDTICVDATFSDGSSTGTATGGQVTDSLGNSYTQVLDIDDTGVGHQRLCSFRCIVGFAGTPTLTLKFTPTPGTSTADFISFNAVAYSGSDSSSAGDGQAGQVQATPTTSTDATTSGNITTTVDGALIHTSTVDSASGANPGTIGTGFTLVQTSGGVILKSGFKTQTTHGSVAGTWTAAANDTHITNVIAVKPAASSGNNTQTPTGFNPTFSLGTPSVQTNASNTQTPTGFNPTMSLGTFTTQSDTTLIGLPSFNPVVSLGVPSLNINNNTGSNNTQTPGGFSLTLSLGNPSLAISAVKEFPVGFNPVMSLGITSTNSVNAGDGRSGKRSFGFGFGIPQ